MSRLRSNLRLHSVLLLSLLALQTGPAIALERGSHDRHAANVVEGGVDRQQVLRYLERLRTTSGAPGVSAAIMSGGRLVFSGGVGVSDIESGSRQDGTSVHNVGSVSKVHAVVAIMQLVEQGKVNLDADIQTYVPWFPRKQAPITVRQILTHTSGIRHYKEGEFGEGDVLAFQQFDTVEASAKRWRDEPLDFNPGEYWSYSSFATNLLQAVVEQASGQGFEEYLRLHVWEPAGMLDTQFDVPARIVPRRGRGYERDRKSGGLLNAQQENVSYKYAGGGIISTDEDMVHLGHALNSGRLLKAQTLRELYRPQLAADIQYPPAARQRAEEAKRPVPKPPRQALIVRINDDGRGGVYSQHGGSVKGSLSQYSNFSRDGIVVALHANAWVDIDLQDAAETLARLALGEVGATNEKAK